MESVYNTQLEDFSLLQFNATRRRRSRYVRVSGRTHGPSQNTPGGSFDKPSAARPPLASILRKHYSPVEAQWDCLCVAHRSTTSVEGERSHWLPGRVRTIRIINAIRTPRRTRHRHFWLGVHLHL